MLACCYLLFTDALLFTSTRQPAHTAGAAPASMSAGKQYSMYCCYKLHNTSLNMLSAADAVCHKGASMSIIYALCFVTAEGQRACADCSNATGAAPCAPHLKVIDKPKQQRCIGSHVAICVGDVHTGVPAVAFAARGERAGQQATALKAGQQVRPDHAEGSKLGSQRATKLEQRTS